MALPPAPAPSRLRNVCGNLAIGCWVKAYAPRYAVSYNLGELGHIASMVQDDCHSLKALGVFSETYH